MTDDREDRKARAAAWFAALRDELCTALESLEDALAGTFGDLPPGRFERSDWTRTDQVTGTPGGGGTMALMRGRVFEKAGVNVSTVSGTLTDSFRDRLPGTGDDPRFWASGISVVAHPRSPRVPAAHMNTRHVVTAGKAWFGGGGDLTPTAPAPPAADAADFHAALRAACDGHDPDYYRRFSEWCDEYFFLRHRNERRGAGGIFYDYLDTGAPEADFAFTRDVGRAFREVYPRLVARRMDEPWTAAEREHQLVRRGRYVEFNLLYDRGTVFGLNTGGNAEAILMSLPPAAHWP